MWSIQSSIFYLLWPTFFKNRGTGFCARFYCSECPKSPYFSMVLRDSKYQVLLRYARMCNRFEITRNQVVRKGTWVRIPPAAPRRSKVRFAPTFFYSCGTKERHPPAPLLLLSESNPLRWASIRVGKRKYPNWSLLPTHRALILLLLAFDRDPQRSRWRLCRLTDAACPLRVLRWIRGWFGYRAEIRAAKAFAPPKRGR